jgi:hypothetical protein
MSSLINKHKFILIHRIRLVPNFQVAVCSFFNNQIYKDMIAIRTIQGFKIIILSKLSKFKIR